MPGCGTSPWPSSATIATAVVTLVAVVAIGLGYTDGRPLADFHVIADAILLLTYLVPLAVTVRTIGNRTETSTYVSLYYVLAGLIWLIGGTLVGNFPGQAVVGGLAQNQFYTSTVVSQWAVGVGIGAAYYIIPKATGNPLYSRSLAMVGFWSLVVTSLWAGLASQVFGPMGDWAESIGAVFAFGTIIPAIAVLANLTGTMQGKWDQFRTDPAIRFAIVGSVAATSVALIAGIQGFRSVSAVIGLTYVLDRNPSGDRLGGRHAVCLRFRVPRRSSHVRPPNLFRVARSHPPTPRPDRRSFRRRGIVGCRTAIWLHLVVGCLRRHVGHCRGRVLRHSRGGRWSLLTRVAGRAHHRSSRPRVSLQPVADVHLR